MAKAGIIIALPACLLLAVGCASVEPDTIAPADVTSLTASDGPGSIFLTWTDNSVDEDVVGYEVGWRPQRLGVATAGALRVPRDQGARGSTSPMSRGARHTSSSSRRWTQRGTRARGPKSPG